MCGERRISCPAASLADYRRFLSYRRRGAASPPSIIFARMANQRRGNWFLCYDLSPPEDRSEEDYPREMCQMYFFIFLIRNNS